MRVFCHLIGKGCYKVSLKNKTKQTSDWSAHKALVVSESWMFVRGCSAFLRARTETWRASLLTGGGKKEGSKGRGKRELLHLSRWQTWEGYRMEKKGWRNPYTSGSCLVPCWTALANWLCKFLSSLLCSALPSVCVPVLLLWSWLPFVAYFFGRVNLISRHPSSSTASRADYETFTAARLGTALERLPEFAHKQPAWHSSGTTPGERGRGQTSTSPSFQLSQLVSLPSSRRSPVHVETNAQDISTFAVASLQIPEFIWIIGLLLFLVWKYLQSSENIRTSPETNWRNVVSYRKFQNPWLTLKLSDWNYFYAIHIHLLILPSKNIALS